MPELITEKSFDLNNTFEYKLSIQVRLDGFSFFILNTHENRLLACNITPVKISNENFLARRFEEWIESDELLLKNYKEINVLFFTEKFTLIPEEAYIGESKKNLFTRLFGKQENKKIISNLLISGNLLLSEIPADLLSVFHKNFENCKIVHPISKILENLPQLNQEKETGLALLFNAQNFYLLLYNQQNLLLANCFRYAHLNDIVFYILSALKQFNVAHNKTQVFLFGQIPFENELKANLDKYFDTVDFPESLKLPEINTETFNTDIKRSVSLL